MKLSTDTRIGASEAVMLMGMTNDAEVCQALYDLADMLELQAIGLVRIGGDVEELTIASEGDLEVFDEWLGSLLDSGLTPEIEALSGVLLIGIRDDGQIDLVTAAEDLPTRRRLAEWSVKLTTMFTAVPLMTWFGVSNLGVPKRISEQDYLGLTTAEQAHVDVNTHPDAVHA